MKKIISVVIMVILSVMLLTPAYAVDTTGQAAQAGQALLSKVVVTGVSQSSKNPDDTINVTVTLKNLNSTAMKQVMVGVSGLSSDTLSLTNTYGPFAVDLDANGTGSVSFDLYASPDIKGGNYPLTLTLTYVGLDNTGLTNSYYTVSDVRSISVMIDSKKVQGTTPQIVVSSYSIGKDKVFSGDTFDMAFTLQNTSNDSAISNVMLNFTSDSNAYTPASGVTNQLYVGDIAAGGSFSGKISLKANSSLPSGIYNVNLGFQYQDALKNPYTSSASISIQFIGTTPVETATPQVVVTSYDIGADQVFGGDEFEMTITLKNTSSDVADNVLLDFASDSNAFTAAPGVPSQLYVGKIAAGDSYTGKLKLKANDSLMSGTYNLNIGIQYLDALSTTHNTATYISVKLEQKQKLTIDNIKLPDSIIVNTKALLNVSYENPGIDDLKNLVMNISGNIADNEKAVSIGTVKAGASGNIDQFITPKSTGSQDLVVSFTFEDSAGNSYTTANRSVTLNVQSADSIIAGNSPNPATATGVGLQNAITKVFDFNQYWLYFLIAGVVLVLVAAGIVWRVLYVRRKRKPEWSRVK